MGGQLGTACDVRDDRDVAADLTEAYAELFREVSAFFRSRGLSAEEASDLSQETLVRMFVHLKRHGRTQPDLRPLARTISRRLYVERGRRARPQLVDLPEAEHLADAAPEPVDHVVSLEERQGVREALSSLTPRHRRVVSMWMGGLRPAEIARELGIKRNAADALLHRARRQLATKLSPGSAFAFFPLMWGRLRSAVRTAAESVNLLDPSGSYAPAAGALATAGLATLLLITQPTAPAPVTELSEATEVSTRAIEVEASKAPTIRTPRAEASAAGAPELPALPTERNIGFETSMGGSGNESVGAGVIFREDAPDASILGPSVDKTVEVVCRTSVWLCE